MIARSRIFLVVLIGCLAVYLGGCETLKGAGKGAQKDLKNLEGIDAWIQEHLW